jgi:phosphomannomutase
VRPSGTEPKLKAYIELISPVANFEKDRNSLESQAEQLKVDLRKILGV